MAAERKPPFTALPLLERVWGAQAPQVATREPRHLGAVSKISQTRMGLCWQEALGNIAYDMKGWLRHYGNEILLLLSNYKEEEKH